MQFEVVRKRVLKELPREYLGKYPLELMIGCEKDVETI